MSTSNPPPAYVADGTYKGTRIDLFQDIPTFDIRNGPPEAAVSLLIKSTIPTTYKWLKIDNLPPVKATSYLDAFIAEYFWYISQNPHEKVTDANRRKVAICLGVARAVATTFYRLTEGDIVAAESARSNMVYRPASPAVTEGPGQRAAIEEGLSFRTGTPAAVQEAISTGFVLTEEERAMLPTLLIATVGIIPVQGFSYLTCSHHYISRAGHVSFRAFQAIEKQCFKDNANGAWFTNDEEVLRDVLWHKSCHPVNLTILLKAATSRDVKEQLVTANAGSAAARLPATEPGVKAAEAYLQLFDTLRPLFGSFDGSIDCEIFVTALRTLQSLPAGDEPTPAAWVRPPQVPEYVVDRKTCVRWIGEVVNRNSAMAAHCYGFYCAMGDSGVTSSNVATYDSLRNAYSLKKLATSHIPTYTLGYQGYGDYHYARNKARKAGNYIAPMFKAE